MTEPKTATSSRLPFHLCNHSSTDPSPPKKRKILKISSPQLPSFQGEDTLHLSLSGKPGTGSIQINLDITAQFNENSTLLDLKILSASVFPWDSIPKPTPAKRPGSSRKRAHTGFDCSRIENVYKTTHHSYEKI